MASGLNSFLILFLLQENFRANNFAIKIASIHVHVIQNVIINNSRKGAYDTISTRENLTNRKELTHYMYNDLEQEYL